MRVLSSVAPKSSSDPVDILMARSAPFKIAGEQNEMVEFGVKGEVSTKRQL